jgi:predicted Fe-Mo cluster-binding NifX family protein
MKICITALGPDLESNLDPRFGRSQYSLILNDKGKIEESIANPGMQTFRGAGITAAQLVASKKVDVIITGNIGPNAYQVLRASNIKIYFANPGSTVKEAFKDWQDKKLPDSDSPSVPGHFGMGGGFGRGGGAGRSPSRGPIGRGGPRPR